MSDTTAPVDTAEEVLESYSDFRNSQIADNSTSSEAPDASSEAPAEVPVENKEEVEAKPKPYQRHRIPQDRVEQMLAARDAANAARIAELQARLEQVEGKSAPAQESKELTKPVPADFIDPDTGKLDAEKYMDARDAFVRETTLREIEQREENKRAEARTNEEHQSIVEVQRSFHSQVNELAQQIPDIHDAMDFLGSVLPPQMQVQLMNIDPLVSYAVANSEELTAMLAQADTATAMRIVGVLEARIASRRQSAAPESAPVRTSQAPQAPERPAPRAPVDLGGGAGASAVSDPLGGDYKTARAHLIKQRGR